ncbi:hypothetical protein BLNAU_10461 [Blattamonas nauphoetae]|uniref:Uncharacterized protein n=1 Tax=Blattamonas nauphoetae TaxID=2049346 RepID=A0ABQ9XT41_9EUKA|nr:hypothetical protein BLNAU_10461 [Blattamonas nauphoetae]
MRYVCTTEHISELVKVMLSDESEPHKLPVISQQALIATEILSWDRIEIHMQLFKPPILEQFLTLLERPPPISPFVLSSFCRLVNIIQNRNLVFLALDHAHSYPICEFLYAVILLIDGSQGRTALLTWIQENSFIYKLLTIIHTTTDPVIPSNLEQLLYNVTSRFMDPNYGATIDDLFTQRDMTLILEIGTNPWNNRAFISIIQFLIEIIWNSRPTYEDSDSADTIDDYYEPSRLVQWVLLDHLQLYVDVLKENPPAFDSKGFIPRPFCFQLGDNVGLYRLKVVILFSTLLRSMISDRVDTAVLQTDFLPTLVELFFQYPHNSVLHSELFTLFEHVLVVRGGELRSSLILESKLVENIVLEVDREYQRRVGQTPATPVPSPLQIVETSEEKEEGLLKDDFPPDTTTEMDQDKKHDTISPHPETNDPPPNLSTDLTEQPPLNPSHTDSDTNSINTNTHSIIEPILTNTSLPHSPTNNTPSSPLPAPSEPQAIIPPHTTTDTPKPSDSPDNVDSPLSSQSSFHSPDGDPTHQMTHSDRLISMSRMFYSIHTFSHSSINATLNQNSTPSFLSFVIHLARLVIDTQADFPHLRVLFATRPHWSEMQKLIIDDEIEKQGSQALPITKRPNIFAEMLKDPSFVESFAEEKQGLHFEQRKKYEELLRQARDKHRSAHHHSMDDDFDQIGENDDTDSGEWDTESDSESWESDGEAEPDQPPTEVETFRLLQQRDQTDEMRMSEKQRLGSPSEGQDAADRAAGGFTICGQRVQFSGKEEEIGKTEEGMSEEGGKGGERAEEVVNSVDSAYRPITRVLRKKERWTDEDESEEESVDSSEEELRRLAKRKETETHKKDPSSSDCSTETEKEQDESSDESTVSTERMQPGSDSSSASNSEDDNGSNPND